MTAPNIEMIASSLRNCSLSGGRRRRRRRGGGGEATGESDGVTVELNSEVALPYHWEQCLDIRTGQVYYINWEDGTRTTVDPRTPAFSSLSGSSSSRRSRSRRSYSSSSGGTAFSAAGAVTAWHSYASDTAHDNDTTNEGDEQYGESSSSSTSRSSAMSSTLSSFSPTDESASGGNDIGSGSGNATRVLVAAGCRACFMFFMVPKHADVCPKCGSTGLLYLGHNGYV